MNTMRNRRDRRKLKAPILISVFFAIIITLIGLLFFTNIFDNIIKFEPKITVETKDEEIENGVILHTETKESKKFTSNITYPITDKESIDLAIHNWIMDQENLYHEEMETTKGNQANLDVQTEVIKVNDNIMSFMIKSDRIVEQGKEYSANKTYVVDLQNDTILHLSDLYNKKEIEKNALYLKIKDKFAESDKIDKSLLKEYLSDSEAIKWTLNEENITFYFDEAQISSNNIALAVEVPLVSMYKLASDGDYKDLVITEKVQAEIDRIAAEEEEARRLAEAEKELDTNGKYVALTFDDGPSESITPRILETLKQYDAKATFYMLSQNAVNIPAIAKQVADEGHEIANHTITHVNLQSVGAERIKKEMFDSMDQIEKATGVVPATFRPPYGNYNQTVIDNAVASDQPIIMWSVDTLDWQSRNSNAIIEKVRNNTRSGSIVLMHDIHASTADALPQIMEYLTAEGFEFVTVSELMPLLDEDGVGPYFGK